MTGTEKTRGLNEKRVLKEGFPKIIVSTEWVLSMRLCGTAQGPLKMKADSRVDNEGSRDSTNYVHGIENETV